MKTKNSLEYEKKFISEDYVLDEAPKPNLSRLEYEKEFVSEDYYNIEYLKNPSEEIKALVVQKDGFTIEYIKNPSEEIQKLAIQENADAIFCIKNPTKEVQKLAIINSNFNDYIINKHCPDIDKQWVEEQKALRNILK